MQSEEPVASHHELKQCIGCHSVNLRGFGDKLFDDWPCEQGIIGPWYIHKKDKNGTRQGSCSVSCGLLQALHLLASWVAAGGETDSNSAARSTAFRAHVQRVPAYLWVAEDAHSVNQSE